MKKRTMNQVDTESKNKKQEKGYIAVLHWLEKEFYGPDSFADAKSKVMLYIRHRSVRDGGISKSISKSEIEEATGVSGRTLKVAIKWLESNKHLKIERSKLGGRHESNLYRLHPDRYKEKYTYDFTRRELREKYGYETKNKTELEDVKVIHSGIDSYPQNDLVGSNSTPLIGSNSTPFESVTTSESLGNSSPKNPLKEPYIRTLSEKDSLLNKEEEERVQEEKRKAMASLANMSLLRMPRDERSY